MKSRGEPADAPSLATQPVMCRGSLSEPAGGGIQEPIRTCSNAKCAKSLGSPD